MKCWSLDLDVRVMPWEIFLVSDSRWWRCLVYLSLPSLRRKRRSLDLKSFFFFFSFPGWVVLEFLMNYWNALSQLCEQFIYFNCIIVVPLWISLCQLLLATCLVQVYRCGSHVKARLIWYWFGYMVILVFGIGQWSCFETLRNGHIKCVICKWDRSSEFRCPEERWMQCNRVRWLDEFWGRRDETRSFKELWLPYV